MRTESRPAAQSQTLSLTSKRSAPDFPSAAEGSYLGCHVSMQSTLPQFPGFFGGGAHRADERAANAGPLEFMEPLDCCASRTGHHVFQGARMLAGFQNHARTA